MTLPGLMVRPRASALIALLGAAASPLLLGCQDPSADKMEAPPPGPMEMKLEPPPTGKGVQFKMVSTIAAGQEIERCQFVQAPPEGLNVNYQEVRYTPGSHHVLLWRTPYTSIPTKDIHGQPRDTSGAMDCPLGVGVDWSVNGIIGGAQSFQGGSLVSLPPDVAVKVPGNSVMIINTHYLNASPKELVAEARINLYTIPDAEVKQEGGVLFFYNPFIRVPASGEASARMRCRIDKEITLSNIQSHMHKRGVNYSADLLDPSAKFIETLYTNTDWENVPVKEWKPGRVIPAGSFLDYHCDYKNSENRTVLQGQSTRDEMCMLLGSYYPRHDELAFCNNPIFVGSGQKSCGASLKCSIDALKGGDNSALYGCVVDSCPAAAVELTTALTCMYSRGGGACDKDCADPTGTACDTCVATICQPALDSCQKATCG